MTGVKYVGGKMYAIIKTGGKQYKVSAGDVITVEKINLAVGEQVSFDEVLLVGEGDKIEIGSPFVSKTVVGEILEHGKKDKVVIFKYKAKKDYRKKQGHRQLYTKVEIKEIGGIVTSKPETDSKVSEVPSMSMKKEELVEFAKAKGVEIDTKATKQVILDTINENLK